MVYISLEEKSNPDLSHKTDWRQKQTSPNAGIGIEFMLVTEMTLRIAFIFCSTKESLKCN